MKGNGMSGDGPQKIDERTKVPDGDPEQAAVDNSSAAINQSTLHDSGAPRMLLGVPVNFGRYRLVRTLGEGGMGRVFLAHDAQLDRHVALKVPRFESNCSSSMLQRFIREARSAALLRHPNICPIFDVGEVDGIQFLTMAYIDGQPLTRHTHKDALLAQPDAAALVAKLARAIHEAHSLGIIHRDLKPSNILLDAHGEPVIMDFGLARRERPGDDVLTHEGAVLGTPAYMSPEQVEGDTREIGPRTDVYSLGVILYELLAGRRPFTGSVAALMAQVLRDPPRPLLLERTDVEPELDRICMRSLSKRPMARFASALELAESLDAFQASSSPAPADSGQLSGEPIIIPVPTEPIETYGLSGSQTQDTTKVDSETREVDSESRLKWKAEASAQIETLLGHTKLAKALTELVHKPRSEDFGQRLAPVLERVRVRVERLLQDGEYLRAITMASALHTAGVAPETLKMLIETVEQLLLVSGIRTNHSDASISGLRSFHCFRKTRRYRDSLQSSRIIRRFFFREPTSFQQPLFCAGMLFNGMTVPHSEKTWCRPCGNWRPRHWMQAIRIVP
jgi:serine/threonine protein kinase